MWPRWRRKHWQLKFLPRKNDRAPHPRAVARIHGKPAESRMQPYSEPNFKSSDVGTVGFACWRRAGDSIVHPANAGDHSLGRAAGAVNRNHGGTSCPPQSLNRIDAERSVLPHTGTHTRLCEFHYDSRDAADEK